MKAFLLVLEIDPVEVGKIYPRLPLHCTIVHWFRTEASADEVKAVFAGAFEGADAVELVSGEQALFGPSADPHSVPVNVMVPSEEFQALHNRLLDAVDKLGVSHTEPDYIREGFHAHVTKQSERRLEEGSRFVATHAYLVEALDKAATGRKQIMAKFKLGR